MKPFGITIDTANDRVKISDYTKATIPAMLDYVNRLAAELSIGKLIIVAVEADWQSFVAEGFVLEAINPGHFRGQPGYYLAKYFKPVRGISTALIEEDAILQSVLQKSISQQKCHLPEGYNLRDACCDDAAQLVQLFNKVFASYPTPIYDSNYVDHLIQKYPFKVITHNGNIVCAASAETTDKHLCAELTDCACLPAYRGKGLNTLLLTALEQDLWQQGFQNLYSIARARSAGINAVLQKLGYQYGGRLVNNCHICGGFEDMNLWYKMPE